jgi:hypothetical protein
MRASSWVEPAAAAALRCGALSGLYLALVGQAPLQEITAGVLGGVATAAFSILLRRVGTPAVKFHAPWLRLLIRLIVSILDDTVRVALALAASIASGRGGRIETQDVEAVGQEADESGHRTLMVLLASIAPNRYVLELQRSTLRLHRLAKAAPPADPRWPI